MMAASNPFDVARKISSLSEQFPTPSTAKTMCLVAVQPKVYLKVELEAEGLLANDTGEWGRWIFEMNLEMSFEIGR